LVFPGRRKIRGNNINLRIEYFNKIINKHHIFLNEARLSALAISIYLASIRVNPISGALKVLFLDDLLIGLDMSNRLPLLGLIKDYFINVKEDARFQIIMTTFDKVWFELVKNYFGNDTWKYIEIYSKKLDNQDFEMPIILDSIGFLKKSQQYLDAKDFKASAVYIRTEFERIIKEICYKKRLLVPFKLRQKELDNNDLWEAIKLQTNIDRQLIEDVEIHRGIVMNPFSHYDLEKPEFERELSYSIEVIDRLTKYSVSSLQIKTFSDIIEKLNSQERKIVSLLENLKRIEKEK
jgi:hypothetical protein